MSKLIMNLPILLICFLALEISVVTSVKICNHNTQALCHNSKGNLSVQDGNCIHDNDTVYIFNSTYTFTCKNLEVRGPGKVYLNQEGKNETSNQNNGTRITIDQLKDDDTTIIGCQGVCHVKVIVVKHRAGDSMCNVTEKEGLHCNITSLNLTALIPQPSNELAIDYSIFDPVIGTWVQCKKLYKSGHVFQGVSDPTKRRAIQAPAFTVYGKPCKDACKCPGHRKNIEWHVKYTWYNKETNSPGTWHDTDHCTLRSNITSSGENCIDECLQRNNTKYYWCHTYLSDSLKLWGFCTPEHLTKIAKSQSTQDCEDKVVATREAYTTRGDPCFHKCAKCNYRDRDPPVRECRDYTWCWLISPNLWTAAISSKILDYCTTKPCE